MNLQSENIDQIVPALIKARGSFKAAVKDAKNAAFKRPDGKISTYTTLDSAIEAVNDALLTNGIYYTHQPDVVDGRTILHTRFLHASGQWIGSAYPVHPVKNDPQGEGSALTYARRYSLMALAGIAPEDDDGNAAVKAVERNRQDAHVPMVSGSPTTGAWDAMDADEQAFLQKIADEVIAIVSSGDAVAAHDYLSSQRLAAEEKIALWTRIDSTTRRKLKSADAAAKTQPTKEAA
jgi:hypothetical protein